MSPRPVVYLLPGLLCDATAWEPQQRLLSTLAEVRVPDLRGFSSLREMALQVMKEAPPRFSVAGHSLGGRVALELMHLFPERIERFALLSVGVHPVLPGERKKRMELVELAEQQGMSAVADNLLSRMLHPLHQRRPELFRTLREMMLRYSIGDLRGQIEAALARDDQSLYLPAIRHKVQLLVGEYDSWSPLSQHQNIRRRLAACKLHRVAEAGHMVMVEQPEAVNRIFLRWLQEPGT